VVLTAGAGVNPAPAVNTTSINWSVNYMLHKGKLQRLSKLKQGQFSLYDGNFSEQLAAYRHALETLHQRYASSAQLEHLLPPDETGCPQRVRAPASSLIAGWSTPR